MAAPAKSALMVEPGLLASCILLPAPRLTLLVGFWHPTKHVRCNACPDVLISLQLASSFGATCQPTPAMQLARWDSRPQTWCQSSAGGPSCLNGCITACLLRVFLMATTSCRPLASSIDLNNMGVAPSGGDARGVAFGGRGCWAPG